MTRRTTSPSVPVGAVTIGRNEGARLISCLETLQGRLSPIIYVDSGSTDSSVEAARARNADVVQLDMSIPFTAARARNAGLKRLKELVPDIEFVLFLDGDCDLVDGFVETALNSFESDQNLAVVCGRRREKYPDASLWNEMIDAEWNTPIGEALTCGGDALMRRTALDAVGGYQDGLIAGEEPDLCYRLRQILWRFELEILSVDRLVGK